MIKITKTQTCGWEAAIRGMRNPMNSWDKGDSVFKDDVWYLGDRDLELALKLSKSGTDHRKFMRMITVYCDIIAPLYWWKEFDTYKVGTVVNSCSTMHKIQEKELTVDDFSHDHLDTANTSALKTVIHVLNFHRKRYNQYHDKKDWWQMIQLLPSSYNQKRTVKLNYEVLANTYKSRKNHKLDEWHEFCKWIESLPYHELIDGHDVIRDDYGELDYDKEKVVDNLSDNTKKRLEKLAANSCYGLKADEPKIDDSAKNKPMTFEEYMNEKTEEIAKIMKEIKEYDKAVKDRTDALKEIDGELRLVDDITLIIHPSRLIDFVGSKYNYKLTPYPAMIILKYLKDHMYELGRIDDQLIIIDAAYDKRRSMVNFIDIVRMVYGWAREESEWAVHDKCETPAVHYRREIYELENLIGVFKLIARGESK